MISYVKGREEFVWDNKIVILYQMVEQAYKLMKKLKSGICMGGSGRCMG